MHHRQQLEALLPKVIRGDIAALAYAKADNNNDLNTGRCIIRLIRTLGGPMLGLHELHFGPVAGSGMYVSGDDSITLIDMATKWIDRFENSTYHSVLGSPAYHWVEFMDLELPPNLIP